jgi:fumarate hydratase class II
MPRYRTEKDTLGAVKVPAEAYYGAQTRRAVENFPISGMRLQISFIKAQALIKNAAARANMEAGVLDSVAGGAIVRAAEEIRAGRFDDQFVVDVFQAGAGTSQNMNMNEVIANRAEELLGGRKGTYRLVHPNDHANMSQSTNDTIHAAIHIAAVTESHEKLLPAMELLEKSLEAKSRAFDTVIKCGRTHLQDAVPIRMGQVFGAYAAMVRQGGARVMRSLDGMLALGVGGTAVGTGLNTPPGYGESVIKHIRALAGYEFRLAPDMIEAMQSFGAVVDFAGALRSVVSDLKKIADDFRLMSSGPRTGFAELMLPAVQPGSSIMPGKVNPVLAEMLDMVVFHAMGNDTTVVQAAQAGQLELNVMMPVIAYNILQEIDILAAGMDAFARKCVRGVKVDEKTCRLYAERSAALATALSPVIGYRKAAELAKEALRKGVLLRDLALQENIVSEKELERLLDLRTMTGRDAPRKERAAKRRTAKKGSPIKRSPARRSSKRRPSAKQASKKQSSRKQPSRKPSTKKRPTKK